MIIGVRTLGKKPEETNCYKKRVAFVVSSKKVQKYGTNTSAEAKPSSRKATTLAAAGTKPCS